MRKGILYGLSHYSWFQYKKCGRTTRTVKERISNMKTSLLGDIVIIYTTDTLIDCYFYEYLMKQILKNYRLKPNKEMFDVDETEIHMIFNFFNELNAILDTVEKLNWYISNNYPEYLKIKKYIKSVSSSNEKPKKKKRKFLYVDTSNL